MLAFLFSYGMRDKQSSVFMQNKVSRFAKLLAAVGATLCLVGELHLSACTYDRILKVSRTIADLDGKNNISPEHVSEAIQHRTFDRTLWV